MFNRLQAGLKAAALMIRIERLKRKARNAYYAMDCIGDEYDCGDSLATFISPRYAAAKQQYASAVAELKRLDPTFPQVETHV